MPITSHIDKTKDLTIFKAIGVLSFDMALPVVKAFYDADPTRHVLWDLIDTTDVQFTSEEVLSIVRFEPRYEGKRELGKTAFVAQKDVIFGLSRMFEIQSGIQEAPYPIKVFRSLYEAHQWLDES
jgi:hypothetical protein